MCIVITIPHLVQETAGQRIALIVDVLHGQGYYVTASVLMEAGIMMSDDQVHPWRFMLLNFSVLVINKISAFLKREKKIFLP